MLVSIPHVSGKILMCLGEDETGELKFAMADNPDDLRLKAKLCGYTHAPAPFAEWATGSPVYGLTDIAEKFS